MASGKTAALYREQQMAQHNHAHKVFSIGHDNNEENVSRGHVLSRSGGEYSATFVSVLTAELAQQIIDDEHTDVFIDEAQFFSSSGDDELFRFCDALLQARLSVYVSALNGDFMRRPWPAISHLFALSPIVVMHHAWCDGERCGDKAYYTYRLSSNTEQVGVHDKYMSLCRNCWPTTP